MKKEAMLLVLFFILSWWVTFDFIGLIDFGFGPR